jgi:hypothetical protein
MRQPCYTYAKIRSLKIEGGKRHADRDGLVLEVRQSGKKVFLFRFQWDKKPQTITLGHYPSLSLADARAKITSYHTITSHFPALPKESCNHER